MPGNHNSAVLKLHGHVDYCFRVSGVNDVGRGPPSQPTERYRTPPAGLTPPLSPRSTFSIGSFALVQLPASLSEHCRTLSIIDSTCEALLADVSSADIVSTSKAS